MTIIVRDIRREKVVKTYKNIPRVEIESEGEHKYILARVEDCFVAVWSHSECKTNQEILSHFSKKYNVSAEVLGGGYLTLDLDRRIMTLRHDGSGLGYEGLNPASLILFTHRRWWSIKYPGSDFDGGVPHAPM